MLESKVSPESVARGLSPRQDGLPIADLCLTFKLTSNAFIFLLLTWMAVPGEGTPVFLGR